MEKIDKHMRERINVGIESQLAVACMLYTMHAGKKGLRIQKLAMTKLYKGDM